MLTTPFEAQAGVGFHTTVSAPADFVRDRHRYEFVEWSDGGDQLHEVDIPPEGLDLEARYRFVNETPVATASASPATGTAPLQVLFDGSGSNDPESDAMTWEWDFGDDSAHSSQESPVHTYSEPGVYEAVLTVTDAHGDSDSATVAVEATVKPPDPEPVNPDPVIVPPPLLPAQGDRTAPLLRFDPRRGLGPRRSLLAGGASDPAGVRFVQVALGRGWAPACAAGGGGAAPAGGPPEPVRRARVDHGEALQGHDRRHWRASLGTSPLPPGGYRLLFRAGDLLGNKTRALEDGRKTVLLRVPR